MFERAQDEIQVDNACVSKRSIIFLTFLNILNGGRGLAFLSS